MRSSNSVAGFVWRSLWTACFATTAFAQNATQPRATTFPAVTIPNTEVRSLHSAATGRDYELYIYLPASRSLSADTKHPVLYLLDGQWDFKLLASIQGGLLYDNYVPDVIVVGITYPGASANYDSLRAVDYTPIASPSNRGSGDGAKFLAFLKTELIPFIETHYSADPSRRALMGSSLGGLFALYAMFTEPKLFSGYVAASPAVTYANRGAFATEAAYARDHTELPAKLFVAVGDQEPLAAPVRELIDTLRRRNYRGLTFESRIIEGERHSGNKPEAFNRGLRFLFRTK
jgi:predicted alpha/beta superfamily hydrolase